LADNLEVKDMEVKKLRLPEQLPAEFDTAPAAIIEGDLPLPVGQTIVPTRFTEARTKATLEKLNVKQGDPIPVDMAERLDAARLKEYGQGVASTKVPTVNINDLRPDP
jgi:hypothetical protein